MPKWQFWKKQATTDQQVEQYPNPVVASRARGFTPPPPRAASGITARSGTADPALSRLLHRREMIEQEIEQAELAGIADNPWAVRARLIDDAIYAIDAELRKPVERVDVPLLPLPATPIRIEVLQAEAPSHVRLTVEGERLDYAEEVDWAERGTNVVRGDLQLVDGSMAKVASSLGLDVEAAEKLALSLFELATSARDLALEAGRPMLQVLVSDLLRPCPECGDLRLWNGVCLRCEERNAARRHREDERKQLFDERDAILKDREAHIERLPSLRKRLAETNAAIERLRESALS